MEGQIKFIRIGDYFIEEQVGYGFIISRSSGEGMQVTTEKLEKLFDCLFDGEFC